VLDLYISLITTVPILQPAISVARRLVFVYGVTVAVERFAERLPLYIRFVEVNILHNNELHEGVANIANHHQLILEGITSVATVAIIVLK